MGGTMVALQGMENLLLGLPDEFVELSFRDFALLGAGDEKKPAIATSEPILEDGGEAAAPEPARRSPEVDQAVGEWSTSVDLGRGFHEYYSKLQQDKQPPAPVILCLRDELRLDSPPASRDASGRTKPPPSREKEPAGGNKMRSGIPHSNFRHRFLVCGIAYCMNCVKLGMGEMSQGRKCVECLGSKFSERYMGRAGKVGCLFVYTRRRIKQQER